MAKDLPSSSDDLSPMEIGEWRGVEFYEQETYEICRGECRDGECQLAVANSGKCPMKTSLEPNDLCP